MGLKTTLRSAQRHFIKLIFDSSVRNKNFCIFSNDCWGGELYRCLDLPYNTPFVGLMLMAPCYIKFLKEPRKYLEAKLEFAPESKYPLVNELRRNSSMFPVGKILDIEVQFMHYKTEEEAFEKWSRRKSRINWSNVYVKFSLDKDYATDNHLTDFDLLPYERKICFSKSDHPDSLSCMKIADFVENGKFLFRASMKQFDIAGWINEGRTRFKGLAKLRGYLLYYAMQ